MIKIFLCLQILDLATTLAGLKIGLVEISPAIRFMMGIGPVAGLVFSKLIALTLLGVCILLHRTRVIGWANCFYAALVTWNMVLITIQLGLTV